MADQAKKKRSCALSIFTRNLNVLKSLMDENSPLDMVTPIFEKVCQYWDNLETCHEHFIELTDIDVETDPAGLEYLIKHDVERQAILVRYSLFVKSAQKLVVQEREDAVVQENADRDRRLAEERAAKIAKWKAELYLECESLKGLLDVVRCNVKNMSNEDRRTEVAKIEEEFKSLKNIRLNILRESDPAADQTQLNVVFSEAETLFLVTKEMLLAEMDPTVSTSGGIIVTSSAKKEAIKLPFFKGDEKSSPYLNFPIWKSQWNLMIDEYEEKWWCGLLWDHTDDAARSRFIGYEAEYDIAMKRLEKFYADPMKVISCIMKEVTSQVPIFSGDYKSLISYSSSLQNNFNRLKSLKLEHEMSNTSTMSSVVKKFPREVVEKWNEHFVVLDVGSQAKPFVDFMTWLEFQRQTWERMVATEFSHSKKEMGRDAKGFYGDNTKKRDRRSEGDDSRDKRVCFKCGKVGHIKRNCEAGNPKDGASKDSTKKQRRPPAFKKYWCAFHKDEEYKGCWSNSCQDLKKMDAAKRIRLLLENGDCKFCCGDHNSSECFRKDRKCGGGKENRGCTKDHNLHEMFCPEANLCFSVQQADVMSGDKDNEGVILSVMKVCGARNGQTESVFWDLGCTSNFVREEHAKSRGFKGKKEDLSVTTLGGTVTDYSVTTYTCVIRDEEGALHRFEAYGMDCITGQLKRFDLRLIRKLFPHLNEKAISRLDRHNKVDYLIGMKHASWHPERAEKCKLGGDLWIYRGMFGSCIGGRHPDIQTTSRKSDALFTVNHVYHACIIRSTEYVESHELEFCPDRGKEYIRQRDLDQLANIVNHAAGNVSHCSSEASVCSGDPDVYCGNASPCSGDASSDIGAVRYADSVLTDADSIVNPVDGKATHCSDDPSVCSSEASVCSGDADVYFGNASSCYGDANSDIGVVRHVSSELSPDVSIVNHSVDNESSCSSYASASGDHAENIVNTATDIVNLAFDDAYIATMALNPNAAVYIPGAGASNQFPVAYYVREINNSAVGNVSPDNGNLVPTKFTVENSSDGCCMSTPIAAAVNPTVGDLESHCFITKSLLLTKEKLFFESESLGTIIEPKCGGCLCSKCPVPGSRYSFREQREFEIISKKVFYDEESHRWWAELPWNCDRNTLPRNEKAALQALIGTERNLMRNQEFAMAYSDQIAGMVERGSAVILSQEELDAWKGDFHYLPHLAVRQLKKSTPVRLCFDASRKHNGFPSMNDCLYKGPDRFMNNLLAVLLGFRNGRVGCAADIAKFHNRVKLIEKDIHMQRFLWRGMQLDERPQTYAVTVNNFGVKPANCIATIALHKSADLFAEKYPEESEELKNQTYIDDELVSAPNKDIALEKTTKMDEICTHAGMPNKGWTYSGDTHGKEVTLGGDVDVQERVLGLIWIPSDDVFKFQVSLDLSTKRCSLSQTTLRDLEMNPPKMLTRRMLLSEVSKIFDPMGLLVPVLLEAKLLIRESWCGEKSIGWDDPLPVDQHNRWIKILKSLFQLEDLSFQRSLWPEEEIDGLPVLIVFSDGAKLAYGAAAYIRWRLKKGGFWPRLIMSKSKISPKKIVSIPRMELNGAIVGNRIKNFILKETKMGFSKIYHLVDSSTVLGYVNKECGAFKPYEGVRVAEIQSSNEFSGERLNGWAWVAGEDNPADWCTKPRSVKEMISSIWHCGPQFLLLEEEDWPIKFSYKTKLDGEIAVAKANIAVTQDIQADVIDELVQRCSSWKKIIIVVAWVLRFIRFRVPEWVSRLPILSLQDVEQLQSPALCSDEVASSKYFLLKYVQRQLLPELEKYEKGRFKKLSPVRNEKGIWTVGSRLRNFVPFTKDKRMPAIIPYQHRITYLIMREAHEFCHSGQDGTLGRFRSEGYWAVKAGNLAKKVKNNCVSCRKLDHKILSQQMGGIPPERLLEPVAWGYCQLDLFGPFSCRGDVNPRTTKKTWCMIIEDVNSGAVHLDIVQDYSTVAVLSTLRRFASLRGWPGVICSDPGSQLESASGILENWWDKTGKSLLTLAGRKNFKWKISPADSPWRQGKAERRIAVIKRILRQAVGDTRISPVELQTVMMESANICNERPIGLSKPREDGSYELLTPNHLLIGRSSNILPDDTEIAEMLPVSCRYRVVQHVTRCFWQTWCKDVTPGLVVRQKWHKKNRNLVAGDLVMICEDTRIKGKYRLAVVDDVKKGEDGNVRSCVVRYFVSQAPETQGDCVRVSRSVQRLSLILPVEEQSSPLSVEENDFVVKVYDNSKTKQL